MAVYKRGKIWWYKFNWSGEPIRESTKRGSLDMFYPGGIHAIKNTSPDTCFGAADGTA
jgi:hypothetical protein